jgi:hypothetical protein
MKNYASKAMVKLRDDNPLMKLWHQLATNNLLVVRIFEFMKLVELANVQIIGSVENERTFSTLNFMKSKL